MTKEELQKAVGPGFTVEESADKRAWNVKLQMSWSFHKSCDAENIITRICDQLLEVMNG